MSVFAAVTIPLKTDQDDVIRVGNTRIRLDTVVHTFNDGHTAEEIVTQYPSLALADVYAVISYYLKNRTFVDEYVKKRQKAATKTRKVIEANPEYKTFRERMLKRATSPDE